MPPAPIEDRRLAAIGLMLLAFLCFTGIDSCAKWLVLAGLPALQVVFVRFAVHAVMVLATAGSLRGANLLRSRRPGLEVWRAFLLLGSTMMNFVAVRYLPLTLTAAIFFTVPIWVCLLAIPLLGERVGRRRWMAILVGFVGVLIITRPWGAEAHWAILLSMGTAIGAALYAIATRRLAGIDSTATQQFYAAGGATLAIAPLAVFDWVWPATGIDWAVLAVIGVFGWAGHQLLTTAHRLAAASTLAPFVYVQILYMSASSWLIFQHPPDLWVLLGALVVVASGLYIWLRERSLAGQTRPQAAPAA